MTCEKIENSTSFKENIDFHILYNDQITIKLQAFPLKIKFIIIDIIPPQDSISKKYEIVIEFDGNSYKVRLNDNDAK